MKRSVCQDVTGAIGGTPLIRLARFTAGLSIELLVKLESMNPLGSVKDRLALALITDAEQSGALKAGATLVEPTSGNTGIGLAAICASRHTHLRSTLKSAWKVSP